MAGKTIALEPPPPLDPDALLRHLDGRYAGVRSRVREVLSRPEFTPVTGLPTAEYREVIFDWMKALTAEGGTALGFPKEYGGGGDVGASIASFETLAHSDLSLLVKVGVNFGLFGGAILHLGSAVHHDRYLADVISMKLPGCFAMTEAGHGSDVQHVRTTATYDREAGEFVVKTPTDADHKEYIGNAACHAQMAVVFAQLVVAGESHGVHALLVPVRDAKGRVLDGVRVEDSGEKLGLNGVDNGRLWFDDVRVPREALLNRYADVSGDGVYSSPIENPNRRFFTMLGTLIQGRVSVSGASVSATKNALTIAVRYGLRRRQFGPPDAETESILLDYRMHQRRLMPLLAKTYALHFAQRQLLEELHRAFTEADYPEDDRRELESRAAGIKAVASWHATETIQECREACGGAGYMSVNRFAALKGDTDVFTTFEGDNNVLLQLVAKSLLTGYRDHFGELDPLGTVGFVAGQVFENVVERVFARKIAQVISDVVRTEEEEDLVERDYQLQLVTWREAHVLRSVARRLKRGVDEGFDPFWVFNECQDHVEEAARAHIDRLLLEAFIDGIASCEDEGVVAVLDKVCDLFALWLIEQNRDWYQEHGRLTSPRAKAITRNVNRLCAEVRGNAAGLVDAFGIPDEILAAPIGLRHPERA